MWEGEEEEEEEGEEEEGEVGKKAAGELTAALVFEASITASDTLPGLTW